MIVTVKVATASGAFDADAVERALLARIAQELALRGPFATLAEGARAVRAILAELRPSA